MSFRFSRQGKSFRIAAVLTGLVAAAACAAQTAAVAPDRPTGVYKVGDTVIWSVQWNGPMSPPPIRFTLKRDGLTVVQQGDLSFVGHVARVHTKLESPASMLFEIRWSLDGKGSSASAGAVASPERILPASPTPKDFDAFWRAKIDEIKRVPFNAQLEPADSGKAGVVYWKATLDGIRRSHVRGQLARPEAGTKFPALLIVQWAGIYPLQRAWVSDRAAEGWLALNIQAHDIPIDEPEAYYRAQAAGPLKNYGEIGNDDRETSYFLRMYLSAYQAVEYLRSRPDWDGKTLVVMGASQGGHQTLMLAGLHPRGVTAALALVPSGCDMWAPSVGRAPAFPQWYDRVEGKDALKVRETSRYFDVANFAKRIKCPVLVGIGLRDEVCPPTTIFAAVNGIRARKQIVIMPKSGHQNENGSQADYYRIGFAGWLSALRAGKAPPISGSGDQS